jgi:hypothetical protein
MGTRLISKGVFRMLTSDRAAGSRMHVLDWLDGGTFVSSINQMLQPSEFFVP